MSWIKVLNSVKYELLVLLLIFSYATYYYLEVHALPSRTINLLLIGPVYYVLAVSTVLMVFFRVRDAIREQRGGRKTERVNDGVADDETSGKPMWISGLAFAGCTFAYVLLLDTIGFVVSSFLYLCVLIFLLGTRSILLTLVLPALVVSFLYLAMTVFLKFPLPQGILI
jgi:hypothetical protein